MVDKEIEQYWFWIKPEDLAKETENCPRLHLFKEIGWAEPYKETDAMNRLLEKIAVMKKELKVNLVKNITDATRTRLERRALRQKMEINEQIRRGTYDAKQGFSHLAKSAVDPETYDFLD